MIRYLLIVLEVVDCLRLGHSQVRNFFLTVCQDIPAVWGFQSFSMLGSEIGVVLEEAPLYVRFLV